MSHWGYAASKLLDEFLAVGKIFNVGSDQEISIRELAERVIQRTGSASKIQLVPYGEAYGPGFEDLQRRLPDCSRLQKLLGWPPRYSLDETIDAVAAHLGEVKPLRSASPGEGS